MYNEDLSDLITVEELCEWLAIGKNTAYSLLNSKKISGFKIGRIWKISRAAVIKYIKQESSL